MLSKRTKYTLAQLVWGAVTIASVVWVLSGGTEPYFSPSDLPVGEFGIGLAGIVAALLGFAGVGLLKRREWRAAGREAGLSPESGSSGVLGYPTLTGTIRGRPVRVRAVRKGSGEGSARRTLLEARLSDPAETGLVLGRAASGDPAAAAPGFGNLSVETTAVDGEFWAVGDEGLAREVLTRSVREAFAGAGDAGGVYAGDVAGVLADGAPDVGGSIGEKLVSHSTGSMTPGDETTVSRKLNHVLLDGEELRRRVEVVVAVADAFEAATGSGERPRPEADTGRGG